MNVKPLFELQKRALRIITFLPFDKHSNPLFKLTKLLKLFDLVKFQTSIFVYTSPNNELPAEFANYFISTVMIHSY